MKVSVRWVYNCNQSIKRVGSFDLWFWLTAAYKHADGKKIDGRRVLVDVERARTVKGWLPRSLGKYSMTQKFGQKISAWKSPKMSRIWNFWKIDHFWPLHIIALLNLKITLVNLKIPLINPKNYTNKSRNYSQKLHLQILECDFCCDFQTLWSVMSCYWNVFLQEAG